MNPEEERDSRKNEKMLLERLDPRVKLFSCAAVLLVIIFFPIENGVRHAALSLLLTAALISMRIPVRRVAGRLLPLFPMLAGIGLISLVFGKDAAGNRLDALLSLSIKSLLCLFSVVVLTASTRISELNRGLNMLPLPRVMVDILGFGIRYAGVFGNEVRRLGYALISRSGGRMSRIRMVRTAAALVPRLVFKALERSERIYAAMLSRGFTGRMPSGESRRMSFLDAAFSLLLGIFLTGIGILG